ncbi:hypothetical protein [Dactylosporangium sp. CA-233914]
MLEWSQVCWRGSPQCPFGQLQVKDATDMRAAAALLFTKMSEKSHKG